MAVTGPLTNALQSYMMGKQQRQQQVDRQRQQQSRQMLGQMLSSGEAPENFAQIDPQAYMMGQQTLRQQEAAQSQAEQQALVTELRQQYTADPSAENLRQLVAVDPDAASSIRETMGAVDEQRTQDLINKGTAFAQVVRNNPEQAMDYFDQNLADEPAFQDLSDELQNEQYDDVLNGIGVGITALGGQEAYDNFIGKDSGPKIGTYNPRDYTPESFAQFRESGDPSVLKRYYAMQPTEIGGTTYFRDDQGNLFLPASPQVQAAADQEGSGGAEPQPQGDAEEGATPGGEPLTPEAQRSGRAETVAAETRAREGAAAEVEEGTPEAQERRRLQIEETSRALERVERLLNSDNLGKITGPETQIPIIGGAQASMARDELNDLQVLGNLLTMTNLGRMTGVLSESDIRLISSAASGMDIGESGTPISEERLRDTLRQIKDRMTRKLESVREENAGGQASGGESDQSIDDLVNQYAD